jgi:hypothetical protein
VPSHLIAGVVGLARVAVAFPRKPLAGLQRGQSSASHGEARSSGQPRRRSPWQHNPYGGGRTYTLNQLVDHQALAYTYDALYTV